MRLAHPDFHFQIRFLSNTIPLFCIERSDLFRKYVSELQDQCEGVPGRFVLSVDWNPVDISKASMMVSDILHPDIGNRRLASALYRKMNSIAISENYRSETIAIKQALSAWLLQLEESIPCAITHEQEPDINDLFKTCKVRFDLEKSLPETLIQYIKICAEFLKASLFILVGVHDFLLPDELEYLCQTALYEEVNLLLIERHMPERLLKIEMPYIIDRDFCEIYNDEDENL